MVLQVALLQSLEQKVPRGACQAAGAWGTGRRPQPLTSVYQMWPREPTLQGKTVQTEAASSPLRSNSPLPHPQEQAGEQAGPSSLTLQDEASSRALCSPWLIPGLSGGDLG